MDIEFSIDKLMCIWRNMELYIQISIPIGIDKSSPDLSMGIPGACGGGV